MIGEKLGRYTLVDTVGTGSMGTVYRAEDSADGSLVAIKVIRSKILYNRERRERFLREILPATQLQHRNICPILEIGDDNDDFYVVTPFMEGKTLEHYMDRKNIPWKRALTIALETSDALAKAHAIGALHRGLKPANIWIRNDGSVVVSDFTLARFTEIPNRATRRDSGPRVSSAETLIPLSALAYMSPEQVHGDLVDMRSDVFSLGVILYEMLTGHHPFESRNSLSRMSAILEGSPVPVSARAPVPEEFNSIIARTLAKSPRERYQSMEELAAALRTVSETLPEPTVSNPRLSSAGRFFPRMWNYRIAIVLSFLLFSLLLLLVKLYFS
jgi:serine/threonine protein kinase